jgi:hypothetical protein
MYAARHSCSPMLNVEAKFGFRVCGQTAQQPPTAEFSIVATMENTTNRVDKPRQYLDRLIAAWYSCNPKPRPRTGTARRHFIIVLLGLCKRLDRSRWLRFARGRRARSGLEPGAIRESRHHQSGIVRTIYIDSGIEGDGEDSFACHRELPFPSLSLPTSTVLPPRIAFDFFLDRPLNACAAPCGSPRNSCSPNAPIQAPFPSLLDTPDLGCGDWAVGRRVADPLSG